MCVVVCNMGVYLGSSSVGMKRPVPIRWKRIRNSRGPPHAPGSQQTSLAFALFFTSWQNIQDWIQVWNRVQLWGKVSAFPLPVFFFFFQ